MVPELSVIKRIESGEYFIYHHPESVDISRLCRSAILLPEVLGIQQLWCHVEGSTASSVRGHLSWSARGESRKSEVGKASSSGCFVSNQDVVLQSF